ncbi:uncharacterized protein EDB91DRAFT_1333471 [Suillus paluster]|uniref:uncharacterized protein n=1 Tax=Suillus paluster TaxID=48578 RepID=UPI001B868AEE|nr:uncharacterized protein EDB91DRAFT_1333471 [Suillus paluster]KAG1752519.1 hypothetical protein EDB91DRAFT_1333471 [Suillus paluster]
MDGREDGRGRVIGTELRCIPTIFLEPCWGLKWCRKYYALKPSDYDIGVITPDGKYNSLKFGGPLAMEHEARDKVEKSNPSPSLPRTIHDTGGQLGLRRHQLSSPPSWDLSVPTSPMPSVVPERTQGRPDLMCSDVTAAHSSVALITPAGTEGTLHIPSSSTGSTLPSIQPHLEPYTSELLYALLPGPSPYSSQNSRAPTVGTPQHLPHSSTVSQDPDALLYSVASDNDPSLEQFAQIANAQFPPDTVNAHSPSQVHAMTIMQAPQSTSPDSWHSLDFSPMSATSLTCSTSFSADSSLIGEFEQLHGTWVVTPMSELMMMGLDKSPQSNFQSEAGMTDEYWQLSRNDTPFSPIHQPRGLSPIDMGVFQLPGTSEVEENTYYLSDTCLFSSSFSSTFAC